ncbi:MAG: tRNA (N6-threonylcarbamoyladenosine(37)-N6)-methyltransferase TrmO [Dehalococcoidia bacterium]|nr:tRNA (N6-threonylcarbamoyladenosine(37)-N6)-methyltransferase TrmO [Dehalococcoidia bacterium]
MNMQSIGSVKSPVIEGVDAGWGDVVSEIHLNPEFAVGLTGLDAFSHILVVFVMHKATWSPESDLLRRPQGRRDMPLLGIFAQRAKHRPNPIGVTSVRLLAIQGSTLRVQGLDAIDGTPVLDIKPYFPQYDRVTEPVTPPWVQELMARYF